MEGLKLEKYKDVSIQHLDSEAIDNETSYINYEVLTYPADYTLEGLVNKLDKELIKIPQFQRKYVWSMAQASRLIESFLLGLPVPAVFLYSDNDECLNVIDGQQRLLSIYYYFKGYFGEEKHGKRTTFKLAGLKKDNPYYEATYSSLRQSNHVAFNKLNDSVLRAFIVKQIQPNDNTSIFHIFERLNTGGTQLQGQEIRNCIYHGKFNDLLIRLNKDASWRDIFGNKALNKHKRDEELVLRFFALYNNRAKYSKPMKDFLSNFMADNRDPNDELISRWEKLFQETAGAVVEALGKKPFILTKGLNVAIFDAVFTTIAKNIKILDKKKIKNDYSRLLNDDSFIKSASSGTTDELSIKTRFDICEKILFR